MYYLFPYYCILPKYVYFNFNDLISVMLWIYLFKLSFTPYIQHMDSGAVMLCPCHEN